MDCDSYNMLYKRFLKRGPGQMLDLAEFKQGDSFLDLCCGTGRASLEAMRRGASRVISVDKTREKLYEHKFNLDNGNGKEPEYFARGFPTFFEHNVRDFLYSIRNAYDKFDCIFCQQAINYWIHEECAGLVKDVLTSKGKFIFNTFNKKPSELPVVKEYVINGLHYAEVAQLVDGIIYHGQFCEGYNPDFQQFMWISTERFMEILKPYFNKITVHTDGPTDIYVCGNS